MKKKKKTDPLHPERKKKPQTVSDILYTFLRGKKTIPRHSLSGKVTRGGGGVFFDIRRTPSNPLPRKSSKKWKLLMEAVTHSHIFIFKQYLQYGV